MTQSMISQWSRVCNALKGDFKHGQPFRSFPMWENHYRKAKGWIDFLSYVECFRSKDFQYDFLEGHNVWQNNHYWSSTQRNVVAINGDLTRSFGHWEWNVSLIGNHIGRNFKPWDGFQNTMPVLSLQPCKREGPNWAIFVFLEAIWFIWLQRGIPVMAGSGKNTEEVVWGQSVLPRTQHRDPNQWLKPRLVDLQSTVLNIRLLCPSCNKRILDQNNGTWGTAVLRNFCKP